MWIVAKIKNNQECIFNDELSKKFKDKFSIYYPRLLIEENNKKAKIKNILGNYIFFNYYDIDSSIIKLNFRFIKGLQYFIFGNSRDSAQINDFIKFCKKSENQEGFISNSFFFEIIKSKAKVISGPLKNIILNIVNIDKKKIIASKGNIKISINKKSGNYCYPL